MKKINIKKLIMIFYTSIKLLIMSFPLLVLAYNAIYLSFYRHDLSNAFHGNSQLTLTDITNNVNNDSLSSLIWCHTIYDLDMGYIINDDDTSEVLKPDFDTFYSTLSSQLNNDYLVLEYYYIILESLDYSGLSYFPNPLIFTNIDTIQIGILIGNYEYSGGLMSYLYISYFNYYINYFLSMFVYTTIVDLFLWFVLFLKEHTVYAFEKEEKL